MKRNIAILLSLLPVTALLLAPTCAPPLQTVAPGGGGGGAEFGPLDETKEVASCTVNPGLIIVRPDPVSANVQAVVLFNSTLITSSVNVLDVTGGTTTFLGSLSPAGVTAAGQRFAGVVQIDASSVGQRELMCTAAYSGDPRRATRSTSVSVVPEPFDAVFDETAIVATSAGEFQVNQIVVDLFNHVSESTADLIAAAVGADIVGFDPATNLYVLQLPGDPTDPGALDALNDAIEAILRDFPDFVSTAFPNFVVGDGEGVDYDSLSTSAPDDQEAFQDANIPAAWSFLPMALAENGGVPNRVNIGLLQEGMESGSANGAVAPHPELNFGCTISSLNDPECPLTSVDAGDAVNISVQLSNAHSASCGIGTVCAVQRPKVDHGTFVAGVIGAVNNAGKGDTPVISNGVLAFANGATGSAPDDNGSDPLLGGSATGSDIPFRLLYDKIADDPANNAQPLISDIFTSITRLHDEGAKIIVLSLGYTLDTAGCATDPNVRTLDAASFASVTTSFRDAIEGTLSRREILFVASAGNCGTNASNHIPGGMPTPPDNLITVGATDPATNALAAFSNTGATVDVTAPGVGVPGPIGYGDAGPSAAAADTTSADPAVSAIAEGSGTSASAAIVAGVAGLYLSVTGDLDEGGVAHLRRVLCGYDTSTGSCSGGPVDALATLQATVATKTDVAILVDTTGSFGDDIATFQNQAPSLLDRLTNFGLDIAVAVAHFQDFPIESFGCTVGLCGFEDHPYVRVPITYGDMRCSGGTNAGMTCTSDTQCGGGSCTALRCFGGSDAGDLCTTNADCGGGGACQADPAPVALREVFGSEVENNVLDVTGAILGIGVQGGADFEESQLEALLQLATGMGNATYTTPGQGGVQSAGGPAVPAFRADSTNRFIVLWTDAAFHHPGDMSNGNSYPGPSLTTVCDALNAANIKVISIIAGGGGQADAEALADCTNSCVAPDVTVDCNGDTAGGTILNPTDRLICPIATDGTGIGDAIAATVEAAAAGTISCPVP